MPLHPIHRRYYAEDLVRQRRAGERRRQVSSQRRGRVDPNPHQIDAVMFALRRIPEGGCILADEVGLGKTIESGLVIAQLLAEGATRILIVVPRPLLGQWQAELVDLFDIEAFEAADPSVDAEGEGVFLAGREYAGGEAGASRLAAAPWDLCLIDEAHEVFAGIHRRYDRAGIYEEESPQAQMAHRVRRVIGASPVLLLTATPIQNSLRELWGLVQYVDPSGTLLGDKPVFEDVFCADDGRGVAAHQAEELRERLTTVVQRTLRRQAQEFLDRPFVGLGAGPGLRGRTSLDLGGGRSAADVGEPPALMAHPRSYPNGTDSSARSGLAAGCPRCTAIPVRSVPQARRPARCTRSVSSWTARRPL